LEKRVKNASGVIIVCLILAFFLTGCEGNSQKAKVETIEGVTYIHNPATPLHPERTVIFEEEFVFDGTDQAGEVRLFKPGGFTVDAKGTVYIEDASDMAIKVFDDAGKFLRPIGRRGQGPGEFTSLGFMFPLPDGRLLVTDELARRTSFFGPEGQFLSSFSWRQNFQRIYLGTNFSHTLEESVIIEETRVLWIRAIDFLGKELITFGKFSLPELKEFPMDGGMTMIPVPWGPASVFAGDQTRQWLYHCPGDRYEIEVYDRQAKLIRKIDQPYDRVPVRSEDISEYRSRFADSPIAHLFLQMEFPKVKSITNHMIVDSAGNLWVRTNEVKRQRGKAISAYDIFNPDGFYDMRVWLDVVPAVFAGGKMYLMDEDETTGLRHVKRFGALWKESQGLR
jgi:hypothetical protein